MEANKIYVKLNIFSKMLIMNSLLVFPLRIVNN